MKIKIMKLHEDASIPSYAHIGDSGFDIKSIESINVKPNSTGLVKTGIALKIETGYELQIRPRSGNSLKTKLRVANSPGTVDSSYTGEICVIVDNISTDDIIIEKGFKIAQGVIMPVIQAEFELVDSLDATDRGSDGFGSTGTM